MPGARISQAHGTIRPIDPATGASSALAFAMYHPAAALRTPAIERESYADIAAVPTTLIEARRRREAGSSPSQAPTPLVTTRSNRPTARIPPSPSRPSTHPRSRPNDPATPQLTLF